MSHRLLEVPAARLAAWVTGFGQRHGPPAVHVGAQAVRLQAPDGACARLDVPFGPADPPADLDPALWLARRCRLAEDALILLVRRGGYAVGVVRAGALTAHRTGTRYVQGRTAAGGRSQQHFARRREGQTSSLTAAATTAAAQVLAGQVSAGTVLVVGGDRALLDRVLADPRVAGLTALPRSPVLDVTDPRLATLDTALTRAGCVRIHLDQ